MRLDKTKLTGIILTSIGLHAGVGLFDPEAWRPILGLLIANLCLNVGAYLMNPERPVPIEREVNEAVIEKGNGIK